MDQGTDAAGKPARNAALDDEFQNLHEIVAAARRKLDQNNWDYIVGGTETETTLKRNRLALESSEESSVGGVGVYSPYAWETEWVPEGWAGRFVADSSRLTTYDVAPAIAFRLAPRLALGFGANYRSSEIRLGRRLSLADPSTGEPVDVADFAIDTDTESALGWNAGLLYRANESFSWGLSYRSKVKVDYAGTARFTQISTGNPVLDAIFAQRIPFDRDLDVETEIEFPDMAGLGVMVALSRDTRLEVDVNWTGWSSFDEVPLDFVGLAPLSSTLEENWDDAMNYRAGLRWMRPSGNEWRFGYVYDETPQPDEHVSPLLPDAEVLTT